MLVKQFSLRWLLGAVTVSGFACLVLGFSVRGYSWAAGALQAGLGLLVILFCQGLLYAGVWLLARAMQKFGRRTRAGASGQRNRAFTADLAK